MNRLISLLMCLGPAIALSAPRCAPVTGARQGACRWVQRKYHLPEESVVKIAEITDST